MIVQDNPVGVTLDILRWTGLSRQKTGLFKVDLLSVIVWLFHTFSLQDRLF
jgi:hypothetical protein